MRKEFVPLAMAGALFIGACGSDSTPPPTPERFTVTTSTPDAATQGLNTPSTAPALEFRSEPAGNFRAADCGRDPNGWAVYIDDTPESDSGEHTIGIIDPNSPEGETKFLAGATIRKIGTFIYEVATSNIDGLKTIPDVVDLGAGPVAEVMTIVGKPYDAVLSGRIAVDNGKSSVYWSVDCLPNFGFEGKIGAVPLLPAPQESSDPAGVSIIA